MAVFHNHGFLIIPPSALSLALCQVDLEEERMKKRAASLDLLQKIVLYSLRVLLLLVSLAAIGAACYGIFIATEFSQVNDVKEEK